ncbi:hypothetical protein EW026_g8021 [Hermanssonia centrifuga]|uniref:Peptide hydrolase n=1 Tax=Hermanssonia centrifuga TaxID=98765 RepID=A0A4S4K5X1_9APHY|nr:hypothetical protein EW026_g8021 [Hermanssonia centrifuga]
MRRTLLFQILASQDYIHLSNDLTSNATYHTGKSAIYFEGTNILVKIDGTDASVVKSDGVLFSAHYDSVSTAPGATDDGMAVVTLLQMVEYLSKPIKRPRRTAVFFFNNGEEDGLNGAHVFFEHPWSNLTTSFINLEGAAAGGRPMLFRSTSLSAARSLRGPGVMHPHGTVLSADAFARGVIRSGTDYSIYAQGMKEQKDGLSGVDIAFYKNRAFYHTPLDSIPGMGKNEGRRSLWAMMETTKGAGLAMLNEDEGVGSGDTGVYFDGRIMVAFSLRTLFVLNVVLLILGPLVVIGLLAWVLILSNKYARRYEEPELTQGDRLKRVLVAAMGWGRFWLALLLAIGLHISLVAGYVKLNPFIFHSKPYLVLTTILALSFLSISLPLSLLNKLWPSPPSSQKFAIVLELYFISWVFLVFATVAVNNIAAVSAVAEAAVRAGRGGEEGGKGEFDLVGEQEVNGADPGDHRYVRGVMYQAPPEEEDGDSHQESEPVETDPTEITPLMHQQRRRSTGGGEYVVGIDNEAVPVSGLKKRGSGYVEFGWWIAQMVALVPLPAVLLFQIVLLLVHSLNNTIWWCGGVITPHIP